MRSPILSIQNLSKIYPNGTSALKGVSFDVQQGEFLVVIGLSGSGKSTLLRCLNRLHDPSSGKIEFYQSPELTIDIAAAEGTQIRELRRNVAMIFQHFNLIERHSVLNNVLYGSLSETPTLASVFGFFSKEKKSSAMDYLRLVGIESKAHERASSLSGGQKQRVAIARALAQKPKILLADEPVASLDPATCHVVMDYLRKVNRELGLTVICNLHFLSLVREYATRVIALKEGEKVFQGDPKEIDEAWFAKIYGEAAKEVHIN